jgi:hypothetical protein
VGRKLMMTEDELNRCQLHEKQMVFRKRYNMLLDFVKELSYPGIELDDMRARLEAGYHNYEPAIRAREILDKIGEI